MASLIDSTASAATMRKACPRCRSVGRIRVFMISSAVQLPLVAMAESAGFGLTNKTCLSVVAVILGTCVDPGSGAIRPAVAESYTDPGALRQMVYDLPAQPLGNALDAFAPLAPFKSSMRRPWQRGVIPPR